MSFLSIMKKIGSLFMEGLTEAIKYLPGVEVLTSFIFPPAVAGEQVALSTAELLQNAIVTVEQKYAASGVQTGTGTQKAAEVLTLTKAAVTTMLADPTVAKGLAAAGITVDANYIQGLISAIVTFLNIQGVTNAPPTTTPVKPETLAAAPAGAAGIAGAGATATQGTGISAVPAAAAPAAKAGAGESLDG